MSKSVEAKQLLDNKVFQYVWDETEDYFLQRVRQRPTEDVEAAIALSVMDQIQSMIESMVMDAKVEDYNTEQAKRYQ